MFLRLWFLFLSLFTTTLLGAANAQLSKQEITLGESVQLVLKGEGRSVLFPDVGSIAGFEIEYTQNSQNIQTINGVTTISSSKIFTFTPNEAKEIEIPPFEIIIDGKLEKTNPIKLTIKAQGAQTEEKFGLKMKADRPSGYVGEQLNIKVLFRRKADEKVMGVEYQQPPFENLWARQVGKENTYKDGDFIVHEISYIAFPQRSGDIRITPAKMRITTTREKRDFFGFMVQEPVAKSLFSNELLINAIDVPGGVKLVGDFKIEAIVDKSESEPSKPINLTVSIFGVGNMDDIDDVELNLHNATVYSDKPQKNYEVKDGLYQGFYKRSFSIVADKDFTIEPFAIRFFDPKTKALKSSQTQKIEVKIKGASPKNTEPTIITHSPQEIKQEGSTQIGTYSLFALFMGGVFAGVVLMLLLRVVHLPKIEIKRDEKRAPKSDKEILTRLLPLAKKDERVDRMLSLLEENLYLAKKHKIDKKELALLLAQVDKKGV